jgi:hypothetical protein
MPAAPTLDQLQAQQVAATLALAKAQMPTLILARDAITPEMIQSFTDLTSKLVEPDAKNVLGNLATILPVTRSVLEHAIGRNQAIIDANAG